MPQMDDRDNTGKDEAGDAEADTHGSTRARSNVEGDVDGSIARRSMSRPGTGVGSPTTNRRFENCWRVEVAARFRGGNGTNRTVAAEGTKHDETLTDSEGCDAPAARVNTPRGSNARLEARARAVWGRSSWLAGCRPSKISRCVPKRLKKAAKRLETGRNASKADIDRVGRWATGT